MINYAHYKIVSNDNTKWLIYGVFCTVIISVLWCAYVVFDQMDTTMLLLIPVKKIDEYDLNKDTLTVSSWVIIFITIHMVQFGTSLIIAGGLIVFICGALIRFICITIDEYLKSITIEYKERLPLYEQDIIKEK
jgi:hypothetical protein